MALDFQLISFIFNWSFINSSQSGLAFTLKNSGLRFTEFFIRKIVNPRLIVEIEAWWTLLQWGSENQTSYVFEWSKRGWMPNGPVFKCHLNTGQPDNFNIKQMDAILFSYVLVRYIWHSPWTDHLNTKTFYIHTSKSLVFRSPL